MTLDHSSWPTSIEYATCCAHWPAAGHRTHLKPRASRAKAQQAIIDSDHHAEMLRRTGERHWYIEEAPHRLLVRAVTAWVDADAAPTPVHPGQLTIDQDGEA